MNCPVCKTVNLLMTDRQGIEIDYCPNCRGVWLDRGELDKLIEKSVPPRAASEDCGYANSSRSAARQLRIRSLLPRRLPEEEAERELSLGSLRFLSGVVTISRTIEARLRADQTTSRGAFRWRRSSAT
jgi:Zn-finger nucleic acid-binding protein